MIVQQFVYTGVLPISYRVNTLFGRVLYSTKSQASPEHLGAKPIGSRLARREDPAPL